MREAYTSDRPFFLARRVLRFLNCLPSLLHGQGIDCLKQSMSAKKRQAARGIILGAEAAERAAWRTNDYPHGVLGQLSDELRGEHLQG
jgi:hypothetical protein